MEMDDDLLLPPSSSPVPSSPDDCTHLTPCPVFRSLRRTSSSSSPRSLPPSDAPGTQTKSLPSLGGNEPPLLRKTSVPFPPEDPVVMPTALNLQEVDIGSTPSRPVSHADDDELRETSWSGITGDPEGFNSDSSDDEEMKTAALLGDMFDRYAAGRGGCGTNIHEAAHQAHMDCVDPANHFPLSATYSTDPYIVNPGSGLTKIGLQAEGFPKPENYARRRFMDAQAIKNIVHGHQIDGSVRNICLHAEIQHDVKASIEWDTDSVFVYPHSLGVFKTDIRLVFTRQIRFNIDSDVHLDHNIVFHDDGGRLRSQMIQLQHIPHLYVGSVDAFKNSTLFFFFPSLFTEGNKSSWLTEEQAHLFFRQVLWPACKAVLPDGSIQHYPPGPTAAGLKAKAKSREHQTEKYSRGLQEHRDYPIQPERLSALWEEIQFRIRQSTETRQCFSSMFILLSVKNIKIDLRSSISLYHSISLFEDLVDKTLDGAQCRIYCDIAVEICPPQPRGGRRSTTDGDVLDDQDEENDPILLLWKTCCLRSELQYLRDTAFGGKQGSARLWHSGFLRDVANLTVTPPKTSWAYKGGWRYGQWYSPEKEILDAQKNYPLDHPDLWKLAIDEHVSRTDKSAHLRPSLERHYDGGKHRIIQSFEEYSDISFGLRFETRITYTMALTVKRMLVRRQTPLSRTLETPEMAWSIAVDVFRHFMVGNFDKYSSLLECVVLSSPRSGITRERSQLIYALIQCLQQFANANLPSQTLLWITSRQVDGKSLYGLGFEQSIPDSGFGWWQDVFDWNTWSVDRELEGELFGLRRILWACYADDIRLSTDTYALIQVCTDHAKENYLDEARVNRSLTALAHFVLREYRRDVLDLLAKNGPRNRKELKEEFSTDQTKENVQFCFEGFKKALVGEVHLVKGSRTKCKEPADLFEWIFGHSQRFERTHFAGGVGLKKNYRVMVDKIREAMKCRPKLPKAWTERLAKEFFKYHWVVPYPDGNGTLISVSDKGGHRSFWAGKLDERKNRWIWAAGNPQSGYPPAWPDTLHMDVTALETLFAEEIPITRSLAVRPRLDNHRIVHLDYHLPRR